MTRTITDKAGHVHPVPDTWDPSRARISYGNTKTGIPSVSLLAGDMGTAYTGTAPAACRDLGTVGGTCAGTCPGCYALKITRNIGPMIKYSLNTLEAKQDPGRFVSLVESELFHDDLTAPRVVRLHDSGDFFSPEYFAACVDMIRRHPGTRFGAYTKAADIVNAYGLENLPENLVLSCSPWEGYCEAIGDLPQFIYDAGDDPEISDLPHCPAVDKNGHRTGITCNKCLHCYRARRGDRWAVYAH